ncbi:hypothetical protein DSO57_1018786 [Entomophthora muscae]|uniref:Uncharacterized protein n=1 Tax=Entomophthora muscae TaxID=34485 RepID=A0ACC2SGW3_9FUNG|nr:hypothetical protein DSO57_1018786 [Entomophthora muscae]
MLLFDNSSQSLSIPPSIADSEPADNEAPPILLLFHNISDDSDLDDSYTDNADAYGYSVLVVPETNTVPYKLRSGKTITTAKLFPEAKEIVSCPYLTKSKRSPVLVEYSECCKSAVLAELHGKRYLENR